MEFMEHNEDVYVFIEATKVSKFTLFWFEISSVFVQTRNLLSKKIKNLILNFCPLSKQAGVNVLSKIVAKPYYEPSKLEKRHAMPIKEPKEEASQPEDARRYYPKAL